MKLILSVLLVIMVPMVLLLYLSIRYAKRMEEEAEGIRNRYEQCAQDYWEEQVQDHMTSSFLNHCHREVGYKDYDDYSINMSENALK